MHGRECHYNLRNLPAVVPQSAPILIMTPRDGFFHEVLTEWFIYHKRNWVSKNIGFHFSLLAYQALPKMRLYCLHIIYSQNIPCQGPMFSKSLAPSITGITLSIFFWINSRVSHAPAERCSMHPIFRGSTKNTS